MQAVSFKDVILLPRYSDISSRLATDISTHITPKIKISIPIVSTNMVGVSSMGMIREMMKCGGTGVLHRFMDREEVKRSIEYLKYYGPVIISLGVKEEDYKLLHSLESCMPNAILVDIAHGDSAHTVKMIRYITKWYPSIEVIGGNVATPAGALRLIEAGACAVRVGIGGGSVCSTRVVTGHGLPTLQSVMDVCSDPNMPDVPVWADGGFKSSGDIVKALAAGASCVTLGGLLAVAEESDGKWEEYVEDGKTVKYKNFYGMSSKEAQEIYRDGLKPGIAPEGVQKRVRCAGHLKDILAVLTGGIRSGLTYSGASNLEELRAKAKFVQLAPGAIGE